MYLDTLADGNESEDWVAVDRAVSYTHLDKKPAPAIDSASSDSVIADTQAMDSTEELIDAGPDIRQQLLRVPFRKIDGVLITHIHYDHVGGCLLYTSRCV